MTENTRSTPAPTEMVSSALGPALVMAGDEPLAGALHSSAGLSAASCERHLVAWPVANVKVKEPVASR